MSTTTPPPNGPEYLEPAGGEPVGRDGSGTGGRRTALVAGAALLAVAAVGGGVWATMSFFGSGADPAEALPAGTLGYASVDLDPSGSQKIEAFRMIEKFPAIKEELGGFDAQDDIRRKIVEEAGCEGLSYDGDVAPWLGTSFAVAAVDTGEDEPSPVGVLEVTDAGAAEDGLAKLAECEGEGAEGGYVIEGDWAVYADSEEIAQQVVDSAAEGSLADDSTYQDWMGRVGEPGIISMYASPDVGPLFAELMASDLPMMGPDLGGEMTSPELSDEMAEMLEGFGGAAGAVRFADGGVELELAADVPEGSMGMMTVAEGITLDVVNGLPEDTAVAYGAALPEGWSQSLLDVLEGYGVSRAELDQGISEVEAQTGLTLPEDLETLLGEQFAVALGADFDVEALANSTDPSGVPFGIVVKGDPEGVNEVMEKLGTAAGMPEMFETESSGDQVVWSLSPDYRSELASDGDLGDSDVYQGVVAESDRAAGVMYVNFDAGDWLTGLAESDPEIRDNLAPLDALGMSSWSEDGTTHSLVRLTTD